MEWKRKVEELRMPLLVAAGNQDWEECERLLEAGARFGHKGARARVEGAVYAFEHFIRHSQADLINQSLEIAYEDNLSFFLLKASLTAEDVQSASSIVDYVFNFRAEKNFYVLSGVASSVICAALTEKWKHADLLREKLPLMKPEDINRRRYANGPKRGERLITMLVELASAQRWSACNTLIDWLQLKSTWLLKASIMRDIRSKRSPFRSETANVMEFFCEAKKQALIIKILPYYNLTSYFEGEKIILWLCNRGHINGLHTIINSFEPTQGDKEGFGHALNFFASKQNWPMCYQLLEMSHISMNQQSPCGNAIEHFSDYQQYELMLKAIQKVDLSSSINGLPVLYQIMKKPSFINIVKYLISIRKTTADDAEGFGLALLVFAKNKDWPMCQRLLTIPNISLDWCDFNATEGLTYAVQYFCRYEQAGLMAAINANPKWKVSSEKIQTLNLMPIPKADAQLGRHFSRPSYLKIDPSPGRRYDAALVNDIFHPILMLMGELKDEVVSGNKEKCEALLVKITEARDNKHEINHHKTT
jgi:hypothetical protein